MRDAGIALSRDYYAPGEQLDGQIVILCDKPFVCNGVYVSVIGEEMTEVEHEHASGSGYRYEGQEGAFGGFLGGHGSGEDRHVHDEKRTHLNCVMPLWGPGEIPAGENRFEFSFILPAGIPPTYAGVNGRISYAVKAKVEIPHAFDLNPSRDIQIIWIPQPAIAEPKTGIIEHAGVRALYIEVTSDVIGPGVDIPLRFILSEEAKCRGIRLQILSCEAVAPEGCSETSESTLSEAYYRLDEIHLGLWTRHLFRVERNVPPPFRTELMELAYRLKVTLDIPWGFDEAISIPLRWPF